MIYMDIETIKQLGMSAQQATSAFQDLSEYIKSWEFRQYCRRYDKWKKRRNWKHKQKSTLGNL
jgi:hypothetical protein